MKISQMGPGTIAAAMLFAAGSALPAAASSATVPFGPGTTDWTVPAGVHSIVVDAWGAQGGRATGGRFGGFGGRTLATLGVTPGEVLEVNVGGAGGDAPSDVDFPFGAGGYNGGGRGGRGIEISYVNFGGGGGGGASDVRRAPYGLGNRYVVAAGGGGGSLACTGGAGGGVVGVAGNCNKWSGGGGFPTFGGLAGVRENDLTGGDGFAGVFGVGGIGDSSFVIPLTGEGVGGGGGGGGWYGGGGGSSGQHTPNAGFVSIGGGSGGGGSAFAQLNTTNMVYSTGVRAGDGMVQISYFVPSVSVSVAPPANTFGWNNSDVGVTFDASNPGGPAISEIGYSLVGSSAFTSVAGSSATINVATEGTTTVYGVARDAAGDESPVASASLRIDKTPPTIVGSVGSPANLFGWHNTDVTVTWLCADALSGVRTCSAATLLNHDGANQGALGSASDFAGNGASASVTGIYIDKTPPSISASTSPAPNTRGWNNTDVTVTFSCSDALSGILTCPTPVTVSTESAGQQVTGTATDVALNLGFTTVNTINIDKTPPRLMTCQVTDITDTRAIIRWTTSELADSQVEFGLSSNYGTTTALDATLVTSHAVSLTGLRPGTTYHALPHSTDIAGNPAVCSDVPFTTSAQNFSLRVDGSTGYAEAPHTADLNLIGDWTVEAWFKDEDPRGFNHDPRQILAKGDRNANAEAPYYLLVGNNHLLAGVRTGGHDYPIDADLAYLGLNPQNWHHVAVTFRADLNVLNLWLDGVHIRYLQVPAHSSVGNTLPLQIGRGGPSTGKYWQGKLDDVRVWNVARRGTDISAGYLSELIGPQAGLVANWHFDEGIGPLAVDATGNHHDATIVGGASFSTDVHP